MGGHAADPMDPGVHHGTSFELVQFRDIEFAADGGWAAHKTDVYGPVQAGLSMFGDVQFRGVVAGGKAGSTIAVLGQPMRPAFVVRLAAAAGGSAAGVVDVHPDGRVVAVQAGDWLSLSGLRFLPASTTAPQPE